MTRPVEIERKFLVQNQPDISGLKVTDIRQGYFTTDQDSVEIRVRQKGEDYFLTVKSDGGLQRDEFETRIDKDQFETLWPATEGKRLEKTRFQGRLDDGHVFELDVFAGTLAPLVMVEVEFDSVLKAEEFGRARVSIST